jgi:hypothetical protein
MSLPALLAKTAFGKQLITMENPEPLSAKRLRAKH